jgi:hypothetical protein
MNKKDKLTLTYVPTAKENTECKIEHCTDKNKILIIQKKYILRDNLQNKVAIVSVIENKCHDDDNKYINNYKYTISFLESKEIYTFSGLKIVDNDDEKDECEKIIFNLKCETGNPQFTKLEYINPCKDQDSTLEKTFIFYNEKKKFSIAIIIFLIIVISFIIYYFSR